MSDNEIFDKKFVYLEWDDVLKGKKVLAGDNLQFMRRDVNDGTVKLRCVEPNNSSSNSSELYPFKDDSGTTWALVYYDPNYFCKIAYAQGKVIQVRNKGSDDNWIVTSSPSWTDMYEYRVKPEKKWRPLKDIHELKQTWLAKNGAKSKGDLYEPFIWVRSKANSVCTRMLTGFLDESNAEEQAVSICAVWNPLDALFRQWEFLDGTPCGVEE